MEKGRLPARPCTCGNKIAGADTHSVCSACLGLQHARDALSTQATCEHCARFSLKTRRRRLARQANLSTEDPMLGVTTPPHQGTSEDAQSEADATTLGATASWGDQLDAMAPLDDPDDLEASQRAEQVDVEDTDSDFGGVTLSLGSDEDDEDYREPFAASPAAKPAAVGGACSGNPDPPVNADLHETCKRAAAKLGIAWPEVFTETTTSRYEGKRLPKAKLSTRQHLPVFPECLEEATRSWSNPLTAKNPVQGGSALDWADMEEKGFSHLPPVEPLLASHLHPSQKSTMTSASPSLPSRADCFQSSLTEKGYKAVAMSVRALNASSLLLAYQAELEDDMATAPTPALWEELCVVTDLCLRLHRCAVQSSGRAMALMVSQERARWLNLSSLSHKEKTQLLDVPVDPKGLFGPAVATMQRRCEEKKKEGEALQLCLPRKVLSSHPPAARQTFAQAVAKPAYRIPKRQPQPQTSSRSQGKPPEMKGAWAKKPFAPSVAPRDQMSAPVTQGAMKKRRAT